MEQLTKSKKIDLLSKIRSIDIFGKPVTLNIDGHNSVNSLWGSLVTVFILVIWFAYSISRFVFLI